MQQYSRLLRFKYLRTAVMVFGLLLMFLPAAFGALQTDTVNIGSGDRAYDVAIQGDGKIVVAGNSNSDIVIFRYSTFGTLDTGFNGGGSLTVDFSGTEYLGVNGLAMQADGKFILAGLTTSGNDFAVCRVGSDGTLDATFDTDGKNTYDLGGTDYGSSAAIQSDGKIIVGGKSNNNFAVIRIDDADGSLDTTYDTDGITTANFGKSTNVQDLAIDSNGKVVAVGDYNTGTGYYYVAVGRFNTDGSLDTTFSGDGMVTVPASGDVRGYAVGLQSSGKIVITGSAGSTDFFILRLNTDGSVDTSFGGEGTGYRVIDLGGSDSARDIVIQSDDKILVIGSTGNDFVVTRYGVNGDSLGEGNPEIQDIGGSDLAYAGALQANNRLIVAGQSDDDFAVAEYATTESIIPTVGEWGFILLALLLGAYSLRRYGMNRS